ncbi:hypothetical protein PanWU01x14_246320 [Parasponia andersonii]|uniref:Uncharacterized protein n=1 Tax=Parasponia andersonii TaxID=3476 RepID=A0A2P5BEM8_PARAD|nr:hypothetical protein PanWU01x14_246320 [Parasponia andersonii]
MKTRSQCWTHPWKKQHSLLMFQAIFDQTDQWTLEFQTNVTSHSLSLSLRPVIVTRRVKNVGSPSTYKASVRVRPSWSFCLC